MSSFKTIVPVDLDKITASLPNGSTVERFEWNARTQTLEMFWHNGKCLTKYTFATEWPMDLLEKQKMPAGVEELLAPSEKPPGKVTGPGVVLQRTSPKQLVINDGKTEPPVEGIISRLVKGMTKPKQSCPLATPTQTPPREENHLTRMMKAAKTRGSVRSRTDKKAATNDESGENSWQC